MGKITAELTSLAKRYRETKDKETLDRLIRGLTPYLRSIAKRHRIIGFESSDLIQIALIEVESALITWDGSGTFSGYMSIIARRRWIDVARTLVGRKKQTDDVAEKRLLLLLPQFDEVDTGLTKTQKIEPVDTITPYDIAAYNDLLVFLQRRLTPEDKKVLLLTVEGFSVQEVAEKMGVTENRVQYRLAHLRQRLRPYLEK